MSKNRKVVSGNRVKPSPSFFSLSARMIFLCGGILVCGIMVIVLFFKPEPSTLSTTKRVDAHAEINKEKNDSVLPQVEVFYQDSSASDTATSISVTGEVFVDSNTNRMLDTGENGFSGAEVDLDGPVHLRQTVGSDGRFSFTNLNPDNYVVSVKIYGLLLSQYKLPLISNIKGFDLKVPVRPEYVTPTPSPKAGTIIYDCKPGGLQPNGTKTLRIGYLQCIPNEVAK